MHVIGAPAGIAAILAVIAVTTHRHNREKRAYWVMVAVTLLLTVAAFFAVLAFTPSLGAVWAYTGDGPGLVALLAITAASGITYGVHLRNRQKFHTHGTPAVGVILAAAAALTVLNIRHVSRSTLGAVAGSWRGAGTAFTDVNTGKAVRAMPATVTGGSHGVILAIVIGLCLLLIVGMVRRSGGRPKGGSPASQAGPRGIGK